MRRDTRSLGPLRFSGLAGLIVSIALSSLACAGGRPPLPAIEYQAEVSVTVRDASGETTTTLIERGRDVFRRREFELEGKPVAVIDRPDLRVTWLLDLESRTFDEFGRFGDAEGLESLPDPFGSRQPLRFVEEGSERLDGVETRRFRAEGRGVSGVAWFTLDYIPFRFEGERTTGASRQEIVVQYTDIELRSQPAYHFAIPTNYEGYALRSQPSTQTPMSTDEIDDVRRRLREESQRGRPVMGTF